MIQFEEHIFLQMGWFNHQQVWLRVFFSLFENRNKIPTGLARRVQQQGRVPLWQGLCMKVAPPRCPELRVGVLACRKLRLHWS